MNIDPNSQDLYIVEVVKGGKVKAICDTSNKILAYSFVRDGRENWIRYNREEPLPGLKGYNQRIDLPLSEIILLLLGADFDPLHGSEST